MKRFISIVLALAIISIALIGCGSGDSDNSNNEEVQTLSPLECLTADANAMARAYMDSDFTRAVNFIYEPLVDMAGGVDDTCALLESAFTESGLTIEDLIIGTPAMPVLIEEQLFAVVPVRMETRDYEEVMVIDSFFLGISKDQGRSWKFVDGAQLGNGSDIVKSLFGTSLDALTLPDIQIIERRPIQIVTPLIPSPTPTQATAAPSPSITLPTGWTLHAADKFTIGLPSNWTAFDMTYEGIASAIQVLQRTNPKLVSLAKSLQAQIGIFKFVAADTDSPPDYNVYMGIIRESRRMSFDEELEVFKKESGEALGTTVVNYQHFNLRGYEAIQMETIDHIYDQGGHALQIVHLSVSVDKGVDRYMIQLTCLPAEVDQYRGFFNSAVDTFDIVK